MPTDMDKNTQRKIAMDARRALSDEERKAFSERICNCLATLDAVKNAKCILSYAASYDEVNPDSLAKNLKSQGIRFAYPVSYKGGIMKAFEPEDDDVWEEGRFGIRSPLESRSRLIEPEEFDVVIVPCVGFDDSLKRLGHGGGYYDRYLPLCSKAKYVGVAFEAQKVDNIVVDEHDTPMDVVVSEDRIYRPE